MSPPARAEGREPMRRTAEIEEITNLYFIHPLASGLVPPAARLGISANAVTMAGMLCGLLAGLAYSRYPDPRFAFAGFILMILWHIMDGADGQLARLTQSQSQFGKVLDGISDTVTFLAVYTGLALALAREYGGRAYVLALAAAIFHAIQSATYEVQRQEYERWGWGRKLPASASASAPRIGGPLDFLDRLFYVGLSFPAADIVGRIRTSMAAALDRQPARAPLIRARYRDAFAPLVRRWSILSANYRTLGIFVCALIGVPEYYFWFEILGLSTLLALLIATEYVCYRRLFSGLDAADVPIA
ncbi:MAG: CDP-alcohol phosphatidyltransferase family protein [Steroidobacteraceae bacterium]